MVKERMDLLELLRKGGMDGDVDFLREALRVLVEGIMDAEVSSRIGAEYGERSPERVTQRNGYRSRAWDTRVGTMELHIPKLREGSYFPSLLEPRRRSERALLAVIQQAYVEGVSTRRVDDLVKALGCEGISKSQVSRICQELDVVVDGFLGRPLDAGPYPYLWLDALTQKVREDGRIVNVNGEGKWCIGGHEAEWPSDTLEVIGDQTNRRYDSVRALRHAEGVRSMFDRDENPYQAMVDRSRDLGVAAWVSVRMNDNHFSVVAPEDFGKSDKGGVTRLRRDHPEWCLTADLAPEPRSVGSWNMAIPEVREHKVLQLTEACRQADWDGVELDWQRHAFHFPEHEGYRLRYTLTDLQRAIRRMTDQIAEERGRPFYVAVRVATTVESCRRIGYDVETWVDEGLCDIIIAAGCSGTDPDAEIEAFTALTDGTRIRLYSGLDTVDRQEAKRLVTSAVWRDAFHRATALGHLDRGADGMYVFNWHATDLTYHGLLNPIGSADTLRGQNKIYGAIHRGPTYLDEPGAVAINDRIYGETAVPLFATLTGDGPTFHVRIHDDVVTEAVAGRLEDAELHIEIEHFSPDDRVETYLDGEPIGDPIVTDVASLDAGDPADVSENKWLVWRLDPQQVAKGTREIKVVLCDRDPRIGVPLVVSHVEVHVNYK